MALWYIIGVGLNRRIRTESARDAASRTESVRVRSVRLVRSPTNLTSVLNLVQFEKVLKNYFQQRFNTSVNSRPNPLSLRAFRNSDQVNVPEWSISHSSKIDNNSFVLSISSLLLIQVGIMLSNFARWELCFLQYS